MDRRWLSFALAGGVVLIDRLTKTWLEASVAYGDTHSVIPGFFDIIHTRNRGMAFGLFADGGGVWRTVLLVGVAVAVLVLVAGFLWRLPRELPAGQRSTRVALALILGGALGNVYDRIVQGSVTDFLDFYIGGYHWPAFNAADSAITIGAALLALDMLCSWRLAERR